MQAEGLNQCLFTFVRLDFIFLDNVKQNGLYFKLIVTQIISALNLAVVHSTNWGTDAAN